MTPATVQMTQNKTFIGNFNCRGRIPNTSQIMEYLDLDTLVLTETWARSKKQLPFHSVQLEGTQSENRQRCGAGVAIISRQKLITVHTISSPAIHAIIARLQSHITIIAVYIPPLQRKDSIQTALQSLNKYIRGKVCIIGDFNARHSNWDKATNTHGSATTAWANQISATIHAPQIPSCRHSSTPDLFISKGTQITDVQCMPGSWSSDHNLVRAHIGIEINWTPIRIPASILNDTKIKKEASRHYQRQIPKIINNLTNANDGEMLEENMEKFTEAVIRPFIHHIKSKPKRFRPGWNAYTDKLAKQRSKLLSQQNTHQNPILTQQIKALDKAIKRIVRRNRRLRAKRQAINLESLPPSELAIQFHRNRILQHQSTKIYEIDGDIYKSWIEDTQTFDSHIPSTKMRITENFKQYIGKALSKVCKNRSPGLDSVSSEMLTIEPQLVTSYLFKLFQKIGTTGYIPSNLTQGYVIPLYKKGDHTNPVNYRPITLLSHIRKVLSIAVNLKIQASYQSHPNQYGFTPRCGTELAALQAHNLTQSGHKYLAVLDLKQAYPSTRRCHVMNECKKKLCNNLNKMIQNFLTDVHFTCKGQQNITSGKMTLGVPTGDPLSPTLYNIFMDTFLERIDKLHNIDSDTPAICFADDVLLASKSKDSMQQLLTSCQEWGQEYHMTWSVPKCFILCVERSPFHLSNQEVQHTKETTYLGFNLTNSGITDRTIIQRSVKSISQLAKWKRIEMKTLRLPRDSKLHLATAVLLPAAEYGLHLCNISSESRMKHTTLIKNITQWILPHCGTAKIKLGQAILRLGDVYTRRKMLQITRLARIHDQVIHISNDQSTPLQTRHRMLTLHRIMMNHPPISNTAQEIHIPVRPNTIIGEAKIKKMKNKVMSQYLTERAKNQRRKIPTAHKQIPAYTINNITIRERGFLDRWYLNQLANLSNNHVTRLQDWLSRDTLTRSDRAYVHGMIKAISEETDNINTQPGVEPGELSNIARQRTSQGQYSAQTGHI